MLDWTKYSTSDPELAPLLARVPTTLQFNDPVAAREKLKQMLPIIQNAAKHELPPDTEYQLEDRKIPVADGGKITARCLKPTLRNKETFPVLVWFHGGGWSMGSIDIDDYTLRRICVTLQLVIINVDYRLLPEYPHSTGLNDRYAALKWTAENVSSVAASTKKGFLVGGFSSGVMAAAIVALRARDDLSFQGHQLTGQFLQYPQVIHPDGYPEKYKSLLQSLEQNKDAPILTRDGLLKTNELMGVRPDDSNVRPLLAPNHVRLPPTFLQIRGLDPLRDDGLVYEQVLSESGVETKLEIYPRMPHGGRNMFPNTAIYQKLTKDQMDASTRCII